MMQPFGFHLSDGTLYTYLQGNEYEDIAAAWDWNCESHFVALFGPTSRETLKRCARCQ